MRKYVISGVIVMAGLLSYFYFLLGGDSAIKKRVVTVNNYSLIAKRFKGRYNSADLESVFYTAKMLGDRLVIINFPLEADSARRGFVHQLIGVEGMFGDIPDGFQRHTFVVSKVVRAVIDAHNLVMPAPKETEELLRAYGQQQNLCLESYTIERYLSERELIIEIPLIE